MSEEKKDDAPNRIMVYLRIRNPKPGEIGGEAGTKELMEVSPDKKVVTLEGGKSYNFDHIWNGKEGHNHIIYQTVGRPVIENIFKGYWGALMVYGQTGTGKSFTMCNFDKGNEGIIPGAMQDIFQKAAQETDRKVTVIFSFIQIYLDRLQDLFNPNCKEELKLTRDAKGVAFPGIVERECHSYEEFKENYDDGHQYRVITATKMNPESSRGHAALFIQVRSIPNDPSGEIRNGKLFMIDLAGYERFSKTGVQEGLMKEEAKTINGSLLSLGNVVQALAEKQEHVPWRNAKLTRMLEDAIGGKAKCSIILTAGPSNEHLHETQGTLYFGSRAMSVKTTGSIQIAVDYKKLAAKLQELLTAAEEKINNLELEVSKRALETEESLATEKASLEARQKAELQKLIDSGASAEQIEKLKRANEEETKMIEEQQREQLEALQEERRRAETIERERDKATEQTATEGIDKDQEIHRLNRELNRIKEELEKARTKAKEADAEARRLFEELNDARVALAKNGIEITHDDDDLLGDKIASPVSKPLLATPELRRELDKRVASVKRMLEETHLLKLQEVQEPLQEEIDRLRALYDEAKNTVNDQLQAQKDALTSMYENEIEQVRRAANEVQDKLKKNHMTVKRSYQKQKEALQEENDALTRQLAEIQSRLGGEPAPATATAPTAGAKQATPSVAEVMILKKQSERKVSEMQQLVSDLRADLDYVQTEKLALEKQLKEYEPTPGEDRLKPAQVRKLKEDFDAMKAEKEKLEKELFKLRAEQSLSGPQKLITGQGEDDETVDDLDTKEDMFGDAEGMKVFCEKLLKYPYFTGKEKINSSHEQILSTITTDLDEYRRAMKIHILIMGAQGSGKSSFVKCLTTQQPLMRSAPEVAPTVHPGVHLGFVEDSTTSKTVWHQLYIKLEDLPPQPETKSTGIGILNRMASVVGVSSSGVPDPAKIYVEIVDLPGSDKFWRGMPSALLASKNTCYTVVYNINQPLDVIRDEIAKQLKIIHASAHRNYPRSMGGDAPRVAVCLVGTHRESLRESKDNAVLSLLNKIIVSLGDTFFSLRGEDTYGICIIGNFAVSCSDWTVLGHRGPKHPTSFRELFTYLGAMPNKLYDTRPSSLLPTVKDSTSHATYTLQPGDDAAFEGTAEKISTLSDTEKRFRKGIVTLLTALSREVNVRWVMSDTELRNLIIQHLGLSPPNSRNAISAVNFVVRELICRGIVTPLPGVLYEAKYLPKHPDDYPPDHTPFSRDGVIVLDPMRLLLIYSTLSSLQHFSAITNKDVLKDRQVAFYDVSALEKLDSSWRSGIVTQPVLQVTQNRFLSLTCSDAKLMIELLSIMGLGLPLKQEVALISPVLFYRPMAPGLIDYVSYLLSNHGDGIGRKYKLNTLPDAFFARLQTVLLPFSHAPAKDVPLMEQNWTDASFLVFDKARLKWGIFGSKIVKDVVLQTQLPVRGVMKAEGDFLYVALTARGPSTAAMMAAVRPILNAVHHHITVLCHREFRGVSASFQEMIIAGCESKRQHLTAGVPSILDSLEAPEDVISVQSSLISNLSDPKGTEIDAALLALPVSLKMESE